MNFSRSRPERLASVPRWLHHREGSRSEAAAVSGRTAPPLVGVKRCRRRGSSAAAPDRGDAPGGSRAPPASSPDDTPPLSWVGVGTARPLGPRGPCTALIQSERSRPCKRFQKSRSTPPERGPPYLDVAASAAGT